MLCCALQLLLQGNLSVTILFRFHISKSLSLPVFCFHALCRMCCVNCCAADSVSSKCVALWSGFILSNSWCFPLYTVFVLCFIFLCCFFCVKRIFVFPLYSGSILINSVSSCVSSFAVRCCLSLFLVLCQGNVYMLPCVPGS